MLTFKSEFFFGVFIGFVLGLLINGMVFNSQLRNMGITNMKSRKSSVMKPSTHKIYSPEIETLWNDLRQLYDKRTELDPKFSFNKMAFEIYKLLEEKAVAASTIRNFYLRRTTPRKKTIEAIQCWIDEEKKKDVIHLDGENENEEIDNSDSKEE